MKILLFMMKIIFILGQSTLMITLVQIIKEKKWDKLSIGVEMDAHYYHCFLSEKIKQGLPNAKIKDSERLVNWVRVVKSDTEIGFMKAASQITQKGMKKAMEVINPGARQCDAVGEIQRALIKGTAEFGGEYCSVLPLYFQLEKELLLHI